MKKTTYKGKSGKQRKKFNNYAKCYDGFSDYKVVEVKKENEKMDIKKWWENPKI